MCSWTRSKSRVYFESGGSEKPSAITPTVYADMKLTPLATAADKLHLACSSQAMVHA